MNRPCGHHSRLHGELSSTPLPPIRQDETLRDAPRRGTSRRRLYELPSRYRLSPIADFCAAAPLPFAVFHYSSKSRGSSSPRERAHLSMRIGSPSAMRRRIKCTAEGISPTAAFRVTRGLSAPSRFRADGLASTVLTVAPAFQFRVRSQALQQLFAKVLQRFVGFLLFRQSLAEQVARFLIAH